MMMFWCVCVFVCVLVRVGEYSGVCKFLFVRVMVNVLVWVCYGECVCVCECSGECVTFSM